MLIRVSSVLTLSLITLFLVAATSAADTPLDGKTDGKQQPSADRGRQAVWCVSSPLTGTFAAWQSLWKKWELEECPDDFLDRANERYGLHQSPQAW
jgi:hypothetical protein